MFYCLPARLEPCACWLVCPCVPCGSCWLVSLRCVLVGSDYLHALNLVSLVVGRLVVGGYLCALELVLCWLVSLVGVVTWIP